MTQFGLSDPQQEYVEHVRDLATTSCTSRGAGEEGHVNRPLLRELGRLGLLRGLFGGDRAQPPRDAAATQLCLLRETLAGINTEAETALALQGLGSYPILQAGHPRPSSAGSRAWSPATWSQAFALSSRTPAPTPQPCPCGPSRTPTAGGCTARRCGSPTPPEADVYSVFARTVPTRAPRVLTAFAVAGDAEGLTGEHLDLLAPHAIGRLVFDGGTGDTGRRARRGRRRVRRGDAHPRPVPAQRGRVSRSGWRRRPSTPPCAGPSTARSTAHPCTSSSPCSTRSPRWPPACRPPGCWSGRPPRRTTTVPDRAR